MGKEAFRIIDLTKKYGRHVVLENINTRAEEGDVLCVIGPSGSGKTTLLRCLARLEAIETGEIWIDSTLAVDGHKRLTHKAVTPGHISMVFQDLALWPHLSALENIAFPLRQILGISDEASKERAQTLIEKMGLKGKEEAYPGTLSVGQQQRVAIARALAPDPKLLLLDEITSALDPELVGGVLSTLEGLAGEGRTLVIVTHHLEFARKVASRVLFLDSGRIIEEAPPAQFFDYPRNERVKHFINAMVK